MLNNFLAILGFIFAKKAVSKSSSIRLDIEQTKNWSKKGLKIAFCLELRFGTWLVVFDKSWYEKNMILLFLQVFGQDNSFWKK